MSKIIVVSEDPVKGKDKHNVAGMNNLKPPQGPAPYSGIGEFDYKGTMKTNLSDFVKIDGVPVATIKSKSQLDPGEAAGGGHAPNKGASWKPPAPPPDPMTLKITDPVGTGVVSSGSGSTYVKSGGSAVQLDGDAIDTCDGVGQKKNSKVSAKGQSFVRCSG